MISAYDEIYCLGDMNIDILIDSAFISRYMNILNGFGWKQIINYTTGVTGSTSTLIDHMLTLDDNPAIECGIVSVQNFSVFLVYLVANISLFHVASPVRLCQNFISILACAQFLGENKVCEPKHNTIYTDI